MVVLKGSQMECMLHEHLKQELNLTKNYEKFKNIYTFFKLQNTVTSTLEQVL